MKRFQKLAAVAAVAFSGTSVFAGPVSIDGNLGGEWTSIPSVTVTHDDGVLIGNFGTPGNTTQGASYTIQVRDDGDFYYVGLRITGDAASSAGNFANLYFDTDPANNNGSDVGFEVTNNDYFIAGVAGSYNASPFLTFNNSNPGTIELAIANSFFTSGPGSGTPYPNGYPAATGDVVLRLSQSFGYSVAGGDSYGPSRLGSASVVTPLPASAMGGLALFGGLGLFGGLKRNRRKHA